MKFHLGKVVKFADLEIGDCFMDCGCICKKTRKYRGNNAVWNLQLHGAIFVDPDRWVIPFEEDKP